MSINKNSEEIFFLITKLLFHCVAATLFYNVLLKLYQQIKRRYMTSSFLTVLRIET